MKMTHLAFCGLLSATLAGAFLFPGEPSEGAPLASATVYTADHERIPYPPDDEPAPPSI